MKIGTWFWLILFVCIFFFSRAEACERKAYLDFEFSHYSSIPDGKPFNNIDSPQINLYMITAAIPISRYAIIHLGLGVDEPRRFFGESPIGLARLTIPLVSW